jgi:hypothetical protein
VGHPEVEQRKGGALEMLLRSWQEISSIKSMILTHHPLETK